MAINVTLTQPQWALGPSSEKGRTLLFERRTASPIAEFLRMKMPEWFLVYLIIAVNCIITISGQVPNHIKEPTNGTVVQAGSDFLISWDATTNGTVTLLLTQINQTIDVIVNGTANTGGFWWSVKASLPTADNYTIQLVVDQGSVASGNISPPFTIESNPVQVAEPSPTTGSSGGNVDGPKNDPGGEVQHDPGKTKKTVGIVVGVIGACFLLTFALVVILYRRRSLGDGKDEPVTCLFDEADRNEPVKLSMAESSTLCLDPGSFSGTVESFQVAKPYPGQQSGNDALITRSTSSNSASSESDFRLAVTQSVPNPTPAMIVEEAGNVFETPVRWKAVVQEPKKTSETPLDPAVDFIIWDPVDDGDLFERIRSNAEEFYLEIEKLPNPGFGVGNAILPADLSLLDPCDAKYFNCSEMLWIQYEATEPVDPESIKSFVRTISELVEPFPVAAFDTGPFGIGLIVSSLSEPQDSDDNRNALGGQGSEWGGEDEGNENPDGGAPGQPCEDRQLSEGNNRDQGDRGGKENGSGAGAASTSSQTRHSRQSPIFTGEVTVHCDRARSQHFKTSFGLNIAPSNDYTGPNFRVRLDSIVVMASSMFRNDDEAPSPFTEESDRLYVIDNICVAVAPSEGDITAPVGTRPQKRHFIRSVTTGQQIQWSIDITACAGPTARLGFGRQNLRAIEHNPIAIDLVPQHIGGGARNDFEWRYKVLADSETHVEMSSRNPPAHEATYVLYPGEPPDFVDIGVQTVFRRKKRLAPIGRSSLTAYIRVFSDVQVMHLWTRLDVKIRSEGRGGFVFPLNEERGAYLKTVAEIEGRKRLNPTFQKSPSSPQSPEANLGVGN